MTPARTVESVAEVIRARGGFARRRDLRALGIFDGQIRAELAAHSIFRVRHGWYSVPDAPEVAIRAIRLGGRLTGIAALETYGLPVPRSNTLDIVVPARACRLRSPLDRSIRLSKTDPVTIQWADLPRHRLGSDSFRVSIDDALVRVLCTADREIAVACCSAVLNSKKWSEQRMDAVFARVPARARCWRTLVNRLDGSHGETIVRLRLADAGIPTISQPFRSGVGWLDFQISEHVYIEVDGAQHDARWTGEGESTWEKDHDRDISMGLDGDRVLRWTYRQLYTDWARCVAAAERAQSV